MMSVPASILEKIPHLPDSPGVYLWRDAQGKVLYVGKAKRLRSRVRSYVATDHRESVKTRALMEQAEALDTIVVPSEAHALILEANLIKEYKPRFNIALSATTRHTANTSIETRYAARAFATMPTASACDIGFASR